MNPLFAKLMGHATHLTQHNRLTEATAAIQKALAHLGSQRHDGTAGHAPPNGPLMGKPLADAHADAVVLDGFVTELREPETPPQAQPKAQPETHPQPPQAPPANARDTPGQFISASYAAQSGPRDYKLFIPAGSAGRALPLVVMLHGCTQDPDDFAAGTRMNELAQAQGFLVLYPKQAPRSNASKCWNWFRPGDQKRGQGEPEMIAGMTRHVLQAHQLDADRVYVAGLSAGGAMAAILGREYPDVYAAIGVHSGVPQGAAHDVPSAFSVMKNGAPAAHPATSGARSVPVIVFHGDSDATVHPRNGEQVLDALRTAQATDTRVVEDTQSGGRFTRKDYRDAAGTVQAEHWTLHGVGHAWSGGSTQGSYTDARGPSASREMLRFFLAHRRSS